MKGFTHSHTEKEAELAFEVQSPATNEIPHDRYLSYANLAPGTILDLMTNIRPKPKQYLPESSYFNYHRFIKNELII